jgi:hypothetical protein
VHEVNQARAPLLTRLNDKLFQKLPGSRASTFAEIDAPALLPLPLQRYEMAHFKTVKVHIDYHVEVERHRYSVPHSLVGQMLEARITTAVVELMHRGYAGSYSRVTDFTREWRGREGNAPRAFVPLSFEQGEAFQFDWSEEGLVVGGIYRRMQVSHLKLYASRAFWLVAYPN